MNILIDISHPAHFNFFKNAIFVLKEEGHTILITALNRGKLPQILKEELEDIQIKFNGKHRGSKWSIIFEANILRFFEQLIYVFAKKIDIAVSCGSFTTGAIFKFILHKPNIQFDDDPERKMNVILEKATSTKLIFPPIIEGLKNIKIMNALKEWAYLSPKYFIPNNEILDRYYLKKNKYLFVREVNTSSLNYSSQKSNLISQIANKFPDDYKVILSLEDKSTVNLYPKSWILLNEPVEDIHSLMYYSEIVISSGDSMAREGAMLGVPSIYCGKREMAANKIMINKGMLFHKNINKAPEFVNQVINKEVEIEEQNKFRAKLEQEWDDVIKIILNSVHKYSHDYQSQV